jgi:hypothetical protein
VQLVLRPELSDPCAMWSETQIATLPLFALTSPLPVLFSPFLIDFSCNCRSLLSLLDD